MTAAQLRKLLGRLNLSQRGAAKLIGRSERAMRDWVLGKKPLPKRERILFRLLDQGKITAKDIESVRNGG